uniref:RxLR effector protein n=1 Tax=Phytophthora sojae TaxID=67593 RepID=G1FR26_PHYSO|nr:Avh48 [Phytophthora sojae]
MRLNPILLTAAAALLVSCNTAAAATKLKQTQLPKVTAADAVQSVDSISGKLTRFLRGVKTVEEEKDESEEDSEEERRIQLKTVDDILADMEAAESKMFVHLSSYDRDILTRIENTSIVSSRRREHSERVPKPLQDWR